MLVLKMSTCKSEHFIYELEEGYFLQFSFLCFRLYGTLVANTNYLHQVNK